MARAIVTDTEMAALIKRQQQLQHHKSTNAAGAAGNQQQTVQIGSTAQLLAQAGIQVFWCFYFDASSTLRWPSGQRCKLAIMGTRVRFQPKSKLFFGGIKSLEQYNTGHFELNYIFFNSKFFSNKFYSKNFPGSGVPSPLLIFFAATPMVE